jgi:hypothetical protein
MGEANKRGTKEQREATATPKKRRPNAMPRRAMLQNAVVALTVGAISSFVMQKAKND